MAQLSLQQAFDHALRQHQAGQLAEAERIYRLILAQQPRHVESIYLLGVIAHQNGRHHVAVELIVQALSLRPDFPEAYIDLGNALRAMGQTDNAIAAYRQAIALRPNYAIAHDNLGVVLTDAGRLDEAIAAFNQAIALDASSFSAFNNLGNVLREKGEIEQSIAACQRAIALNPAAAEAHNNLGNALKDNGQLDQAIASYQKAIALRSQHAETYSNLGNALREKGQLDQAIAAYQQAIALGPDYAGGHWNYSLALLLSGDLKQGWREFEWRWKCKELPEKPRNFVQPLWDGSPLEGRTLLLHADQGFGDAIQFVRYVPLAAQRGGKVALECHRELQTLFQFMVETLKLDIDVSTRGMPLPEFDVQCPLLSLPLAFSTTLQTIPAAAPYLFADPSLAQSWRERLSSAPTAGGLNVGLAWAGSPIHKEDRKRSISLGDLSPLAHAPGVTFYSLQKGDAAEQTNSPPSGLRLINFSSDLLDFSDTAALLSQMDLVISADTCIAHLAGALGKPTWVLLPAAPDWRWLLHRPDSPWYPTMRLFRQMQPGDWSSIIKAVSQELSLMVSKGM